MEVDTDSQGTTGVAESRFPRVQRDERVFANHLLALYQINPKFITPLLHLQVGSGVDPQFICCQRLGPSKLGAVAGHKAWPHADPSRRHHDRDQVVSSGRYMVFEHRGRLCCGTEPFDYG